MAVLHVETEAVIEWRVLMRAMSDAADGSEEEGAVGGRLEELWWHATEEEREAMRACCVFLNRERDRQLAEVR